MDKHFSKEDNQIANKHMKSSSTLFFRKKTSQNSNEVPLYTEDG